MDGLVSLRYPAFVVPHPHHRMWLTHLLREYYDLWDGYHPTLPLQKRVKENIRRWVIHRWDRRALSRLERRFVISATVQRRLQEYLGVSTEVLYPPPQERRYRFEELGDFVLAPSRLHPLKRQELLLRALAENRRLKAVIVGTGSDEERLRGLAAELSVTDRVTFAGFVDDEALCDLYARARVVYFAPPRRGLRVHHPGGLPEPKARPDLPRQRRSHRVRLARRDRDGGGAGAGSSGRRAAGLLRRWSAGEVDG